MLGLQRVPPNRPEINERVVPRNQQQSRIERADIGSTPAFDFPDDRSGDFLPAWELPGPRMRAKSTPGERHCGIHGLFVPY